MYSITQLPSVHKRANCANCVSYCYVTGIEGCLILPIKRRWSLLRTAPVNHIGQLLSRALNDTAQPRQLLRALEGHFTGNREQTSHFHSLDPQCLHLCTRSMLTLTMPAHPWRPGKSLFFFLSLSQQ